MATTTTTSTNTGGIANSLNTLARADEVSGGSESFSEDDRGDDVSVDCGKIGSSYDEEYTQVYRERIIVGGSFFPPDNSESGSGRWEGNGTLLDISSQFPATKSETDSSSLFSCPNSNSIMAIFPPHRSTDSSENDEIIIARNPSISSYFPAYFSDTTGSVSNETRLDRAYSVIRHAMSRAEDEFRHVLIRNTVPLEAERFYGSVDLIDPKAVDELREIATRMIRSGFKKKCIQVYSSVRCDALDECLVILGIEKLSIEEVQKIEWNSLDEKMKKWIQAVKIVVRLILSSEKSLCDQIFCGANKTKEICFNETVKGCVMQLLNFGKAIAIGRRSHEKLFRILDMYHVMAEAMARLEVLVTDDVVINEARDVLSGLGEAACGTFAEFENAVQSQASKKPMQSGEIHHLTRYMINYVRLIVDYYSETLNFLLEIREDDDPLEPLRNDDSDSSKLTPVARRLMVLITSLHSNLEEESDLYEDGVLQ